MKKGTYIDIYVIMACLSDKKRKSNLKHVNELLEKACADPDKSKKKNANSGFSIPQVESIAAH